MYSDLFSPESLADLQAVFWPQIPFAIWETLYVTVLSTAPGRCYRPASGRAAGGGREGRRAAPAEAALSRC